VAAQIMIISSVHTWNDTRVLFREAETLGSHYDVELHAAASFKRRDHNGVEVIGLPQLPRWARPASWVVLGWRACRSTATVVHFHDPELLPLGVLLMSIGKKVIYDVHEDVYQDILQKVWLTKFLRVIFAGIVSFILIFKSTEYRSRLFLVGAISIVIVFSLLFALPESLTSRFLQITEGDIIVSAAKSLVKKSIGGILTEHSSVWTAATLVIFFSAQFSGDLNQTF